MNITDNSSVKLNIFVFVQAFNSMFCLVKRSHGSYHGTWKGMRMVRFLCMKL